MFNCKTIKRLMNNFKLVLNGTLEMDGGTTPPPVIPNPNPQPDPVTPTPTPTPTPDPSEPVGPDLSQVVRLEDYNSLDQALMQQGKYLLLEPNKEYRLGDYQTAEDPLTKGIIGRNAVLVSNLNAPRYLTSFTKDNPEFFVLDTSIWQTDQVKLTPNTKTCILFYTAPNTVKKGMLSWVHSRIPTKQNQLSHQLAWGYSAQNGDQGEFLHIVGADLHSRGSEFLSLKANGGGGIFSTLMNVKIENPDYLNPNALYVKGKIQAGQFIINPDQMYTIPDIKTHYGYHNSNVRTILHVGRFVFNIKDEAIFNERSLRLGVPEDATFIKRAANKAACRLDLQAGDVTSLGTIIEKQIRHPFTKDGIRHELYWEYTFDKDVTDNTGKLELISSSFNLTGDQEAYLVFKRSAMFEWPGVTQKSTFGMWQILMGDRYGHTMYNSFNISLYWQDMELENWVRQTQTETDTGESQGCTLINVNGLPAGYTNPKDVKRTAPPVEVGKHLEWVKNFREIYPA